MKLPAYFINLKQSKKRLDRLLQNTSGIPYFEIHIIQALDGHDPEFPFYNYRHYAKIFWGNREQQNDFKPGAFCCYLSHAKCWENFLKNNTSNYAFIFEDDIQINRANLNSLANSTLPEHFDIIFINNRISRWVKLSNQSYISDFSKLSCLLRDITIDQDYSKMIPSNGTDGYIVSKTGAKKLLKMMTIRSICMDIDYAMILNSLTRSDIEKIKLYKAPLPKPFELFLHKVKLSGSTIEDILLSSYIYNKPIVSLINTPSEVQHNKFISRDVFAK